jgi:hypothetical protein
LAGKLWLTEKKQTTCFVCPMELNVGLIFFFKAGEFVELEKSKVGE